MDCNSFKRKHNSIYYILINLSIILIQRKIKIILKKILIQEKIIKTSGRFKICLKFVSSCDPI